MLKGSQGLFLELVNDILYVVSLRTPQEPATARLEYVNSKVEEITGYKPKDFTENPSLWLKIVHPEDKVSVLKTTEELVKYKVPRVRLYRVKTKKGSYIWMEDRIIPITDGEEVVGFVGVARDITRRKVLEDLTLIALEGDLGELLSKAVAWVKEALGADVVVVYEVPEGSGEGVLRAGEGINKRIINRYRIPLEEGTEFYYTYTAVRPVTVEDVTKERRFKLSSDTFLLGLRSGVCVPIRGKGKPLGTFCVYYKKTVKHTKEDVDFVHSVANVLGLALYRKRFEESLEESERRLHKLSRLYRTLSVIGEIILKERDRDKLLREVCTACVSFGGFKASWVGIFEGSDLHIVCSSGEVEDFLARIKGPVLSKIRRGVGLCGRAYRTGEVVINNDTREVKPKELREEMLKKGYRSSATVPIKLKGKVVGVFNLYADREDFFDQEVESLVRDIGEEVSFALDFLEKEEELSKLSLAVDQTSDWVLITDSDGVIRYANKAVEEITGYSVRELIGKKPSLFKSGKHRDSFYRQLWETILSGRTFRAIFINRRKDGRLFYLDQTITPIKDRKGRVIGFVATGKDITQERELEERIRYLALYDPVTDLPNRTNFMERLRFSLVRSRIMNRTLAVILLDIDRFKYINDTFGYQVGDALLKEMARRLKKALREGDTVARLGSDEFGMILYDLARKEDIVKVLNKIFSNIDTPFRVNGQEMKVTVSVGVSVFPDDGEEAEDLVKKAEVALAHSKETYANSYQFFKEDMNTRITEFLLMERHLAKALKKKEFVIYLQPWFRLSDMKISGMEALLRWESEDMGLVSPSKFVPVLEETGLILKVGEWVLSRACSVAKRWNLPVSVNISPAQFKDEEFPAKVERILKRHRLKGDMLILEITENTVMEDVEFASQALKGLKDLGINVALDDFGTGYSSLAYLRKLPVDFLKIDVTFVSDVEHDPEDRAIVNAIIQMAKTLGLRTVAEGIENQKQLNMLRDMGCDFGQGYHLCRPREEKDLKSFLKV
jgi:diguanylate cyclase (GGDEF)-like protein/PAS domain S-box-containing protein